MTFNPESTIAYLRSKGYLDDAIQEAMLSLYARPEWPSNPQGYAHRVAFRYTAGLCRQSPDRYYRPGKNHQMRVVSLDPRDHTEDDRESLDLDRKLVDISTPESQMMAVETLQALDPVVLDLALNSHHFDPQIGDDPVREPRPGEIRKVWNRRLKTRRRKT